MRNTVVAEIDLNAIRYNLALIRNLCRQSRVMAVVKANAYGHGMLRVAGAIPDVDGFAVARLQEALLLRRAGCGQRILVFSTLLDAFDLEKCSVHEIDITVHSEEILQRVLACAECHPLRVWLKHDSGMHRTGLDSEAFVRADKLLASSKGVIEVIHMTHFSNAGDEASVNQQLSSFNACHAIRAEAEISTANSGAIIAIPDARTSWVRPGLMLYGEHPFPTRFPEIRLRPAMTLRARVIAVREISAGQTVGYNGTWVSQRRSRIATIGIGYGDGYPWHAANGTPIWVAGRIVPLVGRVSMDSLTVDVTESGNIVPGDEAILWGAPLACTEVAECASTIPYELFTSIQHRVRRKYFE